MIDTNDEAARPPSNVCYSPLKKKYICAYNFACGLFHFADKIGSRHVQVFLLFLGMAIAYALRVCMSVALEAMTDTESQNDFPVCTVYTFVLFKKCVVLKIN